MQILFKNILQSKNSVCICSIKIYSIYTLYTTKLTMITKNSGDNITYECWAKRENKQWKPRYDLIPLDCLKRLAELYARWAEVYWDRNWENWDLEYAEKSKSSAWRHFVQYMDWETDEDHMAAVCWNLFAIEHLKNKK